MIADNVIVLKVSITAPSSSITDKHLSEDITDRTGAADGQVRAVKKLLSINSITRWKDKARKLIKTKGVPWSVTGVNSTGAKKMGSEYAIAGRVIDEVSNELQECRENFFDALDEYMGKDDSLYYDKIEAEKPRKGSAFNPNDYPSADEFRARFTWEVTAIPLMDIEGIEKDFRVKLPKQMADQQVQKAIEDERKRVTNCVADVQARAERMILGDDKHPGIVPKLRDYNPVRDGDKRAGRFADKKIYANVDEFREFVAGVDTFADSDRLKQMISSIDRFRTHVRPSNPEVIRTDPVIRNKVISGFMGILSGDASDEVKPKAKPSVESTLTGASQLL